VKVVGPSQLETYCDPGEAMVEKRSWRMMTADPLVEVVVLSPFFSLRFESSHDFPTLSLYLAALCVRSF
jgi:hypothetical protein